MADVFGLNPTSFSSFDGGIDKTLTTSHSVEEELGGCETGEVGVLDEATRFRTVVVLDEVRKSPFPEPKGNSLTLDVLLTDTSNNLSYKNDSFIRAILECVVL